MLDIELEDDSSHTLIRLSGHLADSSDFSKVDFSGVKALVLDMEGVSFVNSIGVTLWLQWAQKVPSGVEVTLRKVPSVFVNMWNIIPNLVPAHWELESFFVPFFNEEKNSQKHVLWVKDKDFKDGALMRDIPKEEVDEKTGESWEIDIFPSQFFNFLKFQNRS